MTLARDAGAGSGWIIKLVVVAALFGVVAHDAIRITVAELGVADDGSLAAQDARQAWAQDRNVQLAYNAGVRRVVAENPANVIPPESFQVAPDGAVTLTVERTATTLVVGRIPAIEDWAVRSAVETSTPPR